MSSLANLRERNFTGEEDRCASRRTYSRLYTVDLFFQRKLKLKLITFYDVRNYVHKTPHSRHHLTF